MENSSFKEFKLPNIGKTCFLVAALETLQRLIPFEFLQSRNPKSLVSKIQKLFSSKTFDHYNDYEEVIKILEEKNQIKRYEEGDSDLILSYILKSIVAEHQDFENFVSLALESKFDCKCKKWNLCGTESDELKQNLILNINPENQSSLENSILYTHESCLDCQETKTIKNMVRNFPQILIISLDKNVGDNAYKHLYFSPLSLDDVKYELCSQIIYESYKVNNSPYSNQSFYYGSLYPKQDSGHYRSINDSRIYKDAKILFYKKSKNENISNSNKNERKEETNIDKTLPGTQLYKKETLQESSLSVEIMSSFISCITQFFINQYQTHPPEFLSKKKAILSQLGNNFQNFSEKHILKEMLQFMPIQPDHEKIKTICACKNPDPKIKKKKFKFLKESEVKFTENGFKNFKKCLNCKETFYKITKFKTFPDFLIIFDERDALNKYVSKSFSFKAKSGNVSYKLLFGIKTNQSGKYELEEIKYQNLVNFRFLFYKINNNIA